MSSYADNIVPYVAVTNRRAVTDLLPHRLLRAPAAEAYYRSIARALRPAVQVPLVLGGGIRSVATMADIVTSGDADFVALARPFIREPGLVRRIEHGLRGTVDCTSCNLCMHALGHIALPMLADALNDRGARQVNLYRALNSSRRWYRLGWASSGRCAMIWWRHRGCSASL